MSLNCLLWPINQMRANSVHPGVFRVVLLSIFTIFATTGWAGEGNNWTLEKEIEYYTNLERQNNAPQGRLSSPLRVAASRNGYANILKEFSKITARSTKWVLLQSINYLNTSKFEATLIHKSDPDNTWRIVRATFINEKSPIARISLTVMDQKGVDWLLNELAESNKFDLSKSRHFHGDMAYITSFNGETLRHIALYWPKLGPEFDPDLSVDPRPYIRLNAFVMRIDMFLGKPIKLR